MKTVRKKVLPLSHVYRLLESGPVVMVSTFHKGKSNIMTMSWHTMIDFESPLVGCIVSDRNHTFGMLKATKECVINIPTLELAKKAVACGNVSGARVDKFSKFDLTPVKGSCVKAPLVGECYANLECKVIDAKMASRYNLFILQVLKAWVDPSVRNPSTIHHVGEGNFRVAGRAIRIASGKK